MSTLPVLDYYEIRIVEDPEHKGTDCYGVVNIEQNVIEYYDNLLPRTFQAMQHMEEKYVEMIQAIDGGTKLELVSSPHTSEPTH